MIREGDIVAVKTSPGVMYMDAGPKTAADVAAGIARRFARATAPSTSFGTQYPPRSS